MKNGDHGFFRWEEELGRIDVSWEELQGKLLEKDKMIVELEAEKKIVDNKVKKLKIKINNQEETMQDMTNKLYQIRAPVFMYSRGEKYVVVAFITSRLIFSIVGMIMNL